MIEAMKQWLAALENASEYIQAEHDQRKEMYEPYGMVHKYSTEAQNLLDNKQAITSLRQAIEQAEEKNCKNCVIDKPCIAKGKDMQICGAFVSKHAKELKQIALDKKAENARELGLDYEPVQAEKQEPVAWMYEVNGAHTILDLFEPPDDAYDEGTLYPLYTTPQPMREWVSLTLDEIWEICKKHDPLQITAYARAIEKALKEKNT